MNLNNIPTTPPADANKSEIKALTKKYAKRIAELQQVMYAQGKHNLLVVMQGMDGSGKDGATANVFKYCHPAGTNVYSFKKPTDLEFAHDFLWRVHKVAPEQGKIQIFNRSHYEDILIQRVHQWITPEQVEQRMAAINAFESLLVNDNHTQVIKFYLHLSYEQQAVELQERLDDPTKHWKHNANDWEERKLWDQYRIAYQYALDNSTIPWIVVPVDSRWYRDYIMTKKIMEVMESLDLSYPPLKEK